MIERHSGKASQPSTTRSTSVTSLIEGNNKKALAQWVRVFYIYFERIRKLLEYITNYINNKKLKDFTIQVV